LAGEVDRGGDEAGDTAVDNVALVVLLTGAVSGGGASGTAASGRLAATAAPPSGAPGSGASADACAGGGGAATVTAPDSADEVTVRVRLPPLPVDKLPLPHGRPSPTDTRELAVDPRESLLRACVTASMSAAAAAPKQPRSSSAVGTRGGWYFFVGEDPRVGTSSSVACGTVGMDA